MFLKTSTASPWRSSQLGIGRMNSMKASRRINFGLRAASSNTSPVPQSCAMTNADEIPVRSRRHPGTDVISEAIRDVRLPD